MLKNGNHSSLVASSTAITSNSVVHRRYMSSFPGLSPSIPPQWHSSRRSDPLDLQMNSLQSRQKADGSVAAVEVEEVFRMNSLWVRQNAAGKAALVVKIVEVDLVVC